MSSYRSYNPRSDEKPERRVHPRDFGRKATSLGGNPMPPICPEGTCRMGLEIGKACKMKEGHCRLMALANKPEPKWALPPRRV